MQIFILREHLIHQLVRVYVYTYNYINQSIASLIFNAFNMVLKKLAAYD